MRPRVRGGASVSRRCALASLAIGLLATGCAVAVLDPNASATHPANPRAAEAPSPAASTTLAIGSGLESQRPAEATAAERAAAPSGQHGHHGHGVGVPTPAAGAHGAHPQAAATPRATPAPSEEATAAYTCPMHPEVTSQAPGKCPKCGMKLVEKH